MPNWKSLMILPALILPLQGCDSAKEMDDLAKAQQCLDAVPQSNPESASACMPPIEKYTSQQASILKCSILMTSGGLIESKMVTAYKLVDDDSNTNREAAFMSALSLDKPNVTTGYDTAVKADAFCQQTGVPGLQYISGIVKMGSFLAKSLAAYSSIDFSDPNAVASASAGLVAECTANPPGANCPTANMADLGSTAIQLSNSYCKTDTADSEVCENITTAVASSNNDPAAAGQALFCYLGNKTYNAQTGQCNP